MVASVRTELDDLRPWFDYLAAAHRGYLETLGKLPPEELSRDRGASYPTVVDIFAHSQGALWFWFSGIAKSVNVPFPLPEKEPGEPPTIGELDDFETYLQARIHTLLNALGPPDLDRVVPRTKGRGTDHDCEVPIRDVLWHLVEEELQHHGELNALLWQIDIDAPVSSWIVWAHTVGRITHP
jgi:uncharacterized damage-inducible protein DinB